jgi:uncharacterized Tic20 family protein
MFAHLAGPLCLLIGVGFTGLGFVGPLIIWLVKKDEFPFVDDQGKEALNFNITLFIAYAVAIAIVIITCGVGFFAVFVPALAHLVFGIVAGIKANDGIYYRYPICIRLI